MRSPAVPLAETLVTPEASRVPEVPELWADRAFLRDVQYQTDANLAARQSIYAYQHPRLDLPPQDSATMGDRLRLDTGEALLRTVFRSVTRHDFIGELRVPDPGPVADYLRSMSRTQALTDPDRLVDVVLSDLPNDPNGLFRLTTHSGCLLCA